jgi:hypothetical protein
MAERNKYDLRTIGAVDMQQGVRHHQGAAFARCSPASVSRNWNFRVVKKLLLALATTAALTSPAHAWSLWESYPLRAETQQRREAIAHGLNVCLAANPWKAFMVSPQETFRLCACRAEYVATNMTATIIAAQGKKTEPVPEMRELIGKADVQCFADVLNIDLRGK